MKKKIKELTVHLYETLYEYIINNNKNLIKDFEKELKTKIVLIKDNNIAPPFFVLKTNEPNKNKSSIIYDDIPKLLSEEEINENKKNKMIKKKSNYNK